MATAMKLVIEYSVFLMVSLVGTGMRLAVADPETSTVWSNCGHSGNSTYRNGSAFGHNLNKFLDSLVNNVYATGFNTSTFVPKGKNSNSTIYGLVQCRGDLDSSDCKHCASTAKANLVQGCRNTSGFIQLDGCFLRYDSHKFYNDIESTNSTPISVLCNTDNSTQPQQFTDAVKARLKNITLEARQSPKLFAADTVSRPSSLTGKIYSLAQCWRDLSQTSCRSCLTYAFDKIFSCQSGAIGAQFGSENCYLRYEVYEFFNISVLCPTPAESPPVSSERKNGRMLAISMGAVAGGIVGFIVAIVIMRRKSFSCLKRTEVKSRTGDSVIAAQYTGGKRESIVPLTISKLNSQFIFKYDILREATSNFNARNKLGGGGFGSVFKGVLPDGRQVAVKRLYIGSRQGDAEFLNEASLISRFQHRNLVKLLGCCVESSERLLVYEYLQNSSLDKILFDATKPHLLDWKERHEIMVGAARGLTYLHEGSEIRIIHRDIKASNILLDRKYRPKIADFGLARFFAVDQSHVSTSVVGTLGYMAPEYALHGQLTEKVDVFSFGVLVLEIISGKRSQSLVHDAEFLVEGTWRLYKAERALEVIDPALKGSYSSEEGIRVIQIGLLCTQAAAALRPSMSQVVFMLTNERENLPSPTKPAFVDLDGLVGTNDKVKRPTVTVTPPQDPDKPSSSADISSHGPSDTQSGGAYPSSSIL
eukprot:PITA_18765